MKRITSIDVAKGIGILLVFLGHILEGNSGVGRFLHNWIYSFHMPLFFIISGFTFALRKETRVRLLFSSLCIPYIVWSVLATLYEIIRDIRSFKSIIFVNLINTISGYGIAPYWFLITLFLSEVAVIHLNRKICNNSVILLMDLLGFGAAIICSYLIRGIDSSLLKNIVISIVRLLWGVSFVQLGYCSREPVSAFLRSRSKGFLFVGGFIFLPLSLLVSSSNNGFNFHKMSIGNPFYFFIGAITGAAFVLSISTLINNNKVLEYFGKNSLGLMCVHYKTMPLWGIVAWIIPAGICLPNYLFVIIRLLLLVLFSCILTQVIMKYAPMLLGKKKGTII